jgi:probable rRNA maturation factor
VPIELNQPKHLDHLDLMTLYEQLLKRTLSHLSLPKTMMLDVAMISSVAMKKYNAQFRNKNYPTDVLSFPFVDEMSTVNKKNPIHLGQILINYQKAYQQAKAYGHAPLREFSFLFVHGLLHLLGYHHDTIEEETTMIALQNKILGKRINDETD